MDSKLAPSGPILSQRRPARRLWLRVLAAAALLAALAWAAATAALWLQQEALLFHPVPLPADAPLASAPDVQEHFVDVPGARLSVLQLRLPAPRGVVFFLHGNGDNLQTWFVNTDFYRWAGFDLVMMDYRGYGKSTGRIESEAQLHADVEAVWRSVAPRYQGLHLVLYGRSLGTGLAAALATQLQPDLTVLVSPYLSLAALAREHYPWVPPQIVRYPLRSDLAVARIRSPLLIVHGDRDTLIPMTHAERLQALAPAAQLVRIAGAGHGDVHEFPAYKQLLADALGALH
ncbi:MAG: alpha/beta fold hydrolase [Roseateles sp.]|jgi:pimeloyl-ACP methyl ester carboxylesterase